jgi:Predicted sugar kinase
MNDISETTVTNGVPAGSLRTFAVETRGDTFSNELKERITSELILNKMVYADKGRPDIVISVGGDGTLLQAFHKYFYCLDHTAFVGVHTGHLGFYADWTAEEVDSLLASITTRQCNIVAYPLLNVRVSYKDQNQLRTYLALNECTIRSGEGLLVADVLIRGEKFESFRGDGLCFSTPTGSTAYNKGLSGAIIHPSLASVQLTEIASINNRVFRTIGSPLILPRHHHCQVRPVNNDRFNVTIDHLSTLHANVEEIECCVASERIRFARFRPLPFWRRVRDSFIG